MTKIQQKNHNFQFYNSKNYKLIFTFFLFKSASFHVLTVTELLLIIFNFRSREIFFKGGKHNLQIQPQKHAIREKSKNFTPHVSQTIKSRKIIFSYQGRASMCTKFHPNTSWSDYNVWLNWHRMTHFQGSCIQNYPRYISWKMLHFMPHPSKPSHHLGTLFIYVMNCDFFKPKIGINFLCINLVHLFFASTDFG